MKKRKQRVKVKQSTEATATTVAGDQKPVTAVVNPRLKPKSKPKTQQIYKSTTCSSSSSSSILNTNILNKQLTTTMMTTLSPAFFRIDALELAPKLLGKYLRKDDVVLQITEVEAYRSSDSACHGRFGITPRTAPIFGPGGHAYVYLCYGLHTMLNIVADKEGVGAAVLIRSCAPVSGLETIQQRRGLETLKPVLLTGPGKIGQALAISTEWSNHPLFEPGGLEVLDGPEPEKILIGPRVGIDYALPEHVNALWRFAIAGTLWISAPKNTLRPP
ncbi:DNA-3-methyladenine glycosylase II [Heracleum sosnowskyi]|uniref:DNA-3-methyladenine glycosylase II n=1 Tax=Heracleum sosnowskyi TaxID=360622 RepID=A0AAD8GS20_9APIA|nr:DNA-3-methyladenine glycosylase II [Heracleum sosnowskyi]